MQKKYLAVISVGSKKINVFVYGFNESEAMPFAKEIAIKKGGVVENLLYEGPAVEEELEEEYFNNQPYHF